MVVVEALFSICVLYKLNFGWFHYLSAIPSYGTSHDK